MKGSIACGHRDGVEKMKEAMQPQLRREERIGHREEDEGWVGERHRWRRGGGGGGRTMIGWKREGQGRKE